MLSNPFNFDNYARNETILKNYKHNFTKTGTTICGTVFNGGVIIATDTRATGGHIVADKYCLKLHKLSDNIYAGGAGTAADLEKVGNLLHQKLKLLKLRTGKQPRVISAVTMAVRHLFRYQGYIGAYLIIGGIDITGPSVYQVTATGVYAKLPFTAMGSGGYVAQSVIEGGYKDNLTEAEAKHLCTEAIKAGVTHDLGSGSSVDVCTIKPEGTKIERSVFRVMQQEVSVKGIVKFPPGTAKVLETMLLTAQSMEIENP